MVLNLANISILNTLEFSSKSELNKWQMSEDKDYIIKVRQEISAISNIRDNIRILKEVVVITVIVITAIRRNIIRQDMGDRGSLAAKKRRS